MRLLSHPLGCWLFCLLPFAQAHAANFIVGDSADTTNLTSLRGALIAANRDTTNLTSLRGVIIEANRLGGTNFILLSQPVYHLTIPGAGEDGAMTGDLDITNGNLTIIGQSSSNVVIDATALGDRVFHILPNAQLTLSNLMVTGGTGGDGGGIYNSGVLTIEYCSIAGNTSGSGTAGCVGGDGGAGGGIYNSGLLEIRDSNISGNFCGSGGDGTCSFSGDGFQEWWWWFSALGPAGSGGSGGGLYNDGSATLKRCSIMDNSGGTGGSGSGSGQGGNGGGICNYGDLTVSASTFRGNSGGSGGTGVQAGFSGILAGGSGGFGGAIYNAGTMILTASTLMQNSAGVGGVAIGRPGPAGTGGSGGAIYTAGTLKLNGCTIAYNLGGAGGPAGSGGTAGIGGEGGGIFTPGGTSVVTLHNTLLASNGAGLGGIYMLSAADPTTYTNRGPAGDGPDLSGPFTSNGHNLISQADASTGLLNGNNGDLVGSPSTPLDPHLGPLQSNGGATLTCALLPGSLAIDAGDCLDVPATDQRGYPRGIGSAPDIGAYEFWPASQLHVSQDEVDLLVTGIAGKTCTVQASANLAGWVTIANLVADSNGIVAFHESGTAPSRFYRAEFTVSDPPPLIITTTTATVRGSSTNSIDADIVSSAITARVTGASFPYEEVSWQFVSGSALIIPSAKTSLNTAFHAVAPYDSTLQGSYRLKIVDAAENVAYGPPVIITLINSPTVVREPLRPPGGGYLP